MKSILLSCSAIGILPRSSICSLRANATDEGISHTLYFTGRWSCTQAGLRPSNGVLVDEVVVITFSVAQSGHFAIKCDA